MVSAAAGPEASRRHAPPQAITWIDNGRRVLGASLGLGPCALQAEGGGGCPVPILTHGLDVQYVRSLAAWPSTQLQRLPLASASRVESLALGLETAG